jgi:hypothetical protein
MKDPEPDLRAETAYFLRLLEDERSPEAEEDSPALAMLLRLIRRLDRLELEVFGPEAPTRPGRKASASSLPAVKGPFVEAVEILDEAKKRSDPR